MPTKLNIPNRNTVIIRERVYSVHSLIPLLACVKKRSQATWKETVLPAGMEHVPLNISIDDALVSCS